MISLSAQFLAWCRSKPADEEYDYYAVGAGDNGCAIIQFCEELGLSSEVERELDTYPHPVCDAAMDWPRTFGALAERVERQLAAAPDEQNCPGHIASDNDPKVCRFCGVHADELRPEPEPRP